MSVHYSGCRTPGSVILWLAACMLVSPVLAREHLQVVTEHWYPYNYVDDKGNVAGQSTKLVRQILQAADVDYDINVYPWTRAMQLASTTPNVLIYTVLRIPERETLFHWLCPIAAKQTHQVYKLSQRQDIILDSEADIAKYTVAATRDTFLHQFLLSMGMQEGQNLQITADDTINMTLFLAGRVDLLIELSDTTDKQSVQQGLAENQVQPLLGLSASHYPDYCLGVSKGTPAALVEKLRKAQQALLNHTDWYSPTRAHQP